MPISFTTSEIVSISILILTALASLPLVLRPPFIREALNHPFATPLILVCCLLAAWFMLYLMGRWPLLLHVAAGLAALTTLLFWWRGRPGYGKRKNLPPGSLALTASLDAISQRSFYADQADQHGPVFKMSQFGRPVLCIHGLKRGQQLLNEHSESLAGAELPLHRIIPSGYLRYMHAESHKAIAPLFRKSFSSLALSEFETNARSCFRLAIEEMSEESAQSGNGVSPHPRLRQAVTQALTWMLYGLKSGTDDAEAVRLSVASLDPGGNGPRWRRKTRRALSRFDQLIEKTAESWKSSNNIPPSALHSLLEEAPEALGNPSYTWNFAMISRIAFGDVSGFSHWLLKKCCDHPQAMDRVRDELQKRPPSASNSRAAQPTAALSMVLETLRMEQSEYLYRKVDRSFEFEQFSIPRGWLVRLLIQESHRDPNVFVDPESFRPERFMERSFSRAEYAPFGVDAHGCIGFRMTQFLGEILVTELAPYDLKVTSDGPLERLNRHRFHWTPSSKFRFSLTRR